MKSRNSKAIESSKKLLAALITIGKDLKLDDNLNTEAFSKLITTVETDQTNYNNELVEVANKRIKLQDHDKELLALQQRFKNGVRMKFGEESAEYETIGGTRPSQRKSYVRTKKNDAK